MAFEKDPLADQSGDQLLKRQVHQLRYLLSSYQAQWIRTHKARAGQTDEEALQAYIQRLERSRWMLMRLPAFTIRSP